jgi:hypothetical protein
VTKLPSLGEHEAQRDRDYDRSVYDHGEEFRPAWPTFQFLLHQLFAAYRCDLDEIRDSAKLFGAYTKLFHARKQCRAI